MNFPIPQISIANWVDNLPVWTLMAQLAPDAAVVQSASNAIAPTWSMTMLVPIVIGALGYLLIQQGVFNSKPAWIGGIVTCAAAIVISLGFVPMSLESYILMGFCALATGGGVGFLVAREPVHAALGFATAVLSTCGVMFIQSALFIAAATMIVYAGATIIIFLFVLMFAQQTDLRTYDIQLTNPLLASAIGAILLATITMCVTGENAIAAVQVDATRPYSHAELPKDLRSLKAEELLQKTAPEARSIPSVTAGLGRSLYTDYLLAVELAGTVLLVATIGAIALAQRTQESQA
jgi:NADH-quinone oxidoreductase subunit J